MSIDQNAFKALLKQLSEEDLERWAQDLALHGSGGIRQDKDGNVSYVPFLEIYRMELEAQSETKH